MWNDPNQMEGLDDSYDDDLAPNFGSMNQLPNANDLVGGNTSQERALAAIQKYESHHKGYVPLFLFEFCDHDWHMRWTTPFPQPRSETTNWRRNTRRILVFIGTSRATHPHFLLFLCLRLFLYFQSLLLQRIANAFLAEWTIWYLLEEQGSLQIMQTSA